MVKKFNTPRSCRDVNCTYVQWERLRVTIGLTNQHEVWDGFNKVSGIGGWISFWIGGLGHRLGVTCSMSDLGLCVGFDLRTCGWGLWAIA